VRRTTGMTVVRRAAGDETMTNENSLGSHRSRLSLCRSAVSLAVSLSLALRGRCSFLFFPCFHFSSDRFPRVLLRVCRASYITYKSKYLWWASRFGGGGILSKQINEHLTPPKPPRDVCKYFPSNRHELVHGFPTRMFYIVVFEIIYILYSMYTRCINTTI
jgi:hypothetical protein